MLLRLRTDKIPNVQTNGAPQAWLSQRYALASHLGRVLVPKTSTSAASRHERTLTLSAVAGSLHHSPSQKAMTSMRQSTSASNDCTTKPQIGKPIRDESLRCTLVLSPRPFDPICVFVNFPWSKTLSSLARLTLSAVYDTWKAISGLPYEPLSTPETESPVGPTSKTSFGSQAKTSRPLPPS